MVTNGKSSMAVESRFLYFYGLFLRPLGKNHAMTPSSTPFQRGIPGKIHWIHSYWVLCLSIPVSVDPDPGSVPSTHETNPDISSR